MFSTQRENYKKIKFLFTRYRRYDNLFRRLEGIWKQKQTIEYGVNIIQYRNNWINTIVNHVLSVRWKNNIISTTTKKGGGGGKSHKPLWNVHIVVGFLFVFVTWPYSFSKTWVVDTTSWTRGPRLLAHRLIFRVW